MLHRRGGEGRGQGPAGIPPLDFDTYEVLRLAEMPKVETVLVPTYDFWGGVGEPVRSLPLKNVKLV
jgi:isoquinoline 1-oxidoreductase beta subunit